MNFNRRKFLQLGATSMAALPLTGHAFSHGFVVNSKTVPFYKVVYDENFKDCLNFAEEAQKLGAATHGISGDVSALWFQDIKPLLQDAPGIVAGLTRESSALYIGALAREMEHYQVFRGDHYLTEGNITGHQISAPDYMLQQARIVQNSGISWGFGMARLLSQYRPAATQTSVTLTPTSPVNDIDDNSERLVSWIIAPLYNRY
jgi:hypothetical protein